MSKKRHSQDHAVRAKQLRATRSAQSTEQLSLRVDGAYLLDEKHMGSGAAAVQADADRLSDGDIPTAQRRALAARIGRVAGNRYLQRVMLQKQAASGPTAAEPNVNISGTAASYMPYRVASNDTLASIASKFGVDGGWRTLHKFPFNASRIDDPDALLRGEWIAIPNEAIRNRAAARAYAADTEFPWDEIQSEDRTPSEAGDEPEELRYPRKRRVELKVDPAPPVTKVTIPVNRPRGKATDSDVVKAILNGDNAEKKANMTAAQTAAVGKMSSLNGGPIPFGVPGQWNRLDDPKLQRQLDEMTLKIYVEKFTDKTHEELLKEHSPEQRNDPITEKRPQPEQTVYCKFDSVEFNENLTADEQWAYTVAQVVAYITSVNRQQPDETPFISAEGYASPVGKEKYNENLAQRRATTIADKLQRALDQAPAMRGVENYAIMAIGKGVDDTLVIY